MTIRLRPGVKFQDGADLTAKKIVEILNVELPKSMGPAFEDVEALAAPSASAIQVRLKRPTPFLEEALETSIVRPDHPSISTGPFSPASPDSLRDLRANANYYLGAPVVSRVLISNYPTVRAAWADMLRGQIDMLYEVGADSLDLLKGSTSISVYSFTRNYQYVVALNVLSPKLRSPAVRRALNLAIDRPAVVRDALGGRGIPSSGPVWPHHWLFSDRLPKLSFDPQQAEALLVSSGLSSTSEAGGRLTVKCLVPPDSERLALVIKRQLEAVGVVLDLRVVSYDEIVSALRTRAYEAVLFDALGGQSLFRNYQLWHSGAAFNPGALGSQSMDVALDGLRHAASEDGYRRAVVAFQQSAIDDPAAIFVAWSERARAVSNRFRVPAEPDRDVFIAKTLRLWRPVAGQGLADGN